MMRLDSLRDLWGFLRVRKRYWLVPVILILMAFGTLLVLTETSVVAPLIYTLF